MAEFVEKKVFGCFATENYYDANKYGVICKLQRIFWKNTLLNGKVSKRFARMLRRDQRHI